MKYELNTYNRNLSDQELLDDLKKIASKLGNDKIIGRDYSENGGRFAVRTIERRFGSWNKALKKANLEPTLELNGSEIELFKNIEEVWISLGRQPTTRDMRRPLSKYSTSPYCYKFDTFRKALEAFVEFIDSDKNQNQETEVVALEVPLSEEQQSAEAILKHQTKRLPSERLKVQVLMRDGNKCRLCGITVTGENIHFDHIKPWSKGGETALENLQVLCAKHNLAKGDLDHNTE